MWRLQWAVSNIFLFLLLFRKEIVYLFIYFFKNSAGTFVQTSVLNSCPNKCLLLLCLYREESKLLEWSQKELNLVDIIIAKTFQYVKKWVMLKNYALTSNVLDSFWLWRILNIHLKSSHSFVGKEPNMSTHDEIKNKNIPAYSVFVSWSGQFYNKEIYIYKEIKFVCYFPKQIVQNQCLIIKIRLNFINMLMLIYIQKNSYY